MFSEGLVLNEVAHELVSIKAGNDSSFDEKKAVGLVPLVHNHLPRLVLLSDCVVGDLFFLVRLEPLQEVDAFQEIQVLAFLLGIDVSQDPFEDLAIDSPDFARLQGFYRPRTRRVIQQRHLPKCVSPHQLLHHFFVNFHLHSSLLYQEKRARHVVLLEQVVVLLNRGEEHVLDDQLELVCFQLEKHVALFKGLSDELHICLTQNVGQDFELLGQLPLFFVLVLRDSLALERPSQVLSTIEGFFLSNFALGDHPRFVFVVANSHSLFIILGSESLRRLSGAPNPAHLGQSSFVGNALLL